MDGWMQANINLFTEKAPMGWVYICSSSADLVSRRKEGETSR